MIFWSGRRLRGFAALAANRQRIQEKIRDLCGRRDWKDWDGILTDWLQKLLQTRITLPDVSGQMSLAGLLPEDYQPELEFLFASHGATPENWMMP